MVEHQKFSVVSNYVGFSNYVGYDDPETVIIQRIEDEDGIENGIEVYYEESGDSIINYRDGDKNIRATIYSILVELFRQFFKQESDFDEWETFFNIYKPVKNHLDNNASFDGYMFETFGNEVDFVKSCNELCIWTLCEEDDIQFIQAGWHFVNRFGYLITEVPWEDKDEQYRI